MWRYLIAWLPMVAIAIANGVLRDVWYGPRVGELAAHQISTFSAALWLGLYIRWVVRTWPPVSGRHAIAVGLVWLAMTVAFELGFGHWVAGHPWEHLLGDYNLLAGRLWVLLLLWITLAPYLFRRLHGRCPD